MTDPKFNSVIADYMDAFLNECRVTHRSIQNIINHLNMFDKFLCHENITSKEITEEVYDSWVESFRDLNKDSTIYHKTGNIISLLKYMYSLGVKCFIPRKPLGRIKTSFVPYIFTHVEIEKIFSVADGWRDKCMKPEGAAIVMPIGLRLLYSTGMRVSEMINLRNKDLNLKTHVLRIRVTKNWEERLAPVNQSLEKALLQYIGYRNRLPAKGLDAPEAYLLVNHRGRKISQETFLARFHAITKKAGIEGNNQKHGSRVHDLRHTACIHVMSKLLAAGYDLYNCIPILSAFMGHKSIYSTEQYLRLTAEFYPELIKYTSKVTSPIDDVILKSINHENEL